MMKYLEIHEQAAEDLLNVLRRLVYHGENNSALVIGSRGTGKTVLINRAIQSLRDELRQKQCDTDLILIYLSGCLQNDDKSALLEITRQLRLENVINGKVFGSFADSFEFLLKSFRSGGKESKPLVFIMDEFDLFTKNKTQLLLYTLLNTIQSSSSPMCMIGATSRIDVLDLLEKRIKSRFSHRQIYTINSYDFNKYIEFAKYFAQLRRLEDVTNGSSTMRNRNQKTLTECVDKLFENPQVIKSLSAQYNYDKSLSTLKRLMILPSLKLKEVTAQGLKDHNIEPVINEIVRSSYLLNLDTKLALMLGLSVLELTLIVVMMDMSIAHADEPFNFDLIYNAYVKFVTNKNFNQEKQERQVILKVRDSIWCFYYYSIVQVLYNYYQRHMSI